MIKPSSNFQKYLKHVSRISNTEPMCVEEVIKSQLLDMAIQLGTSDQAMTPFGIFTYKNEILSVEPSDFLKRILAGKMTSEEVLAEMQR